MKKSLSQLRIEIAERLGFGSQAGSVLIQAPMIDSILKRSQEAIISQFGTQIGSIVPAMPFDSPDDFPSVPEYPLFIKSLLMARAHYNQPYDSDQATWAEWERGVRGA